MTVSLDALPVSRWRDEQRVEDMMDHLCQGRSLPKITVRRAGHGWAIVDGNHRVEANRRLGLACIEAQVTL